MGFLSIAGGVVGAIKGGIDLALGRQKRKEREEYRDDGQTKAERDQMEAGHEARERMDGVKPTGDAATRKRLRKHGF